MLRLPAHTTPPKHKDLPQLLPFFLLASITSHHQPSAVTHRATTSNPPAFFAPTRLINSSRTAPPQTSKPPSKPPSTPQQILTTLHKAPSPLQPSSTFTSTSTTALRIRNPEESKVEETLKDLVVENLNKDKDQSAEVKQHNTDTMPSKSEYYESSRSSSEGDRIHYDPRRERQSSSTKPSSKRPVVVHNNKGPSNEPKRSSKIDGSRWQ